MALRPGSRAAVVLWKTGRPADYASALEHYDECVKKTESNGNKSTKGLVKLDVWMRTGLPKKVAATRSMSKEDILKVRLFSRMQCRAID